MSRTEELKRAAAAEALQHVTSGMVLGLGTGSTVTHFLNLLGESLRTGKLRGIRGVPTSERTASAARDLGIPLSTLEADPILDLTVDGADEVGPGLALIKGLGGALLREKLVAQASGQLFIIADMGKVVSALGTRSPLPVEVIPFGWKVHDRFFRSLGAVPRLRVGTDAEPYVTDNGNLIVDCHFEGGIADPEAVETALRARAGVVESGLFLGMATRAFVAAEDGVQTLERGHGTS